MNKNFVLNKSPVITLIILFVLLFKTQFVHRSSWIGSSGPSTFGLGWPIPYLVWDISMWPMGVDKPLSLQERTFNYWSYNKFLLDWSITGFLVSFVFWYFITVIVLFLLTKIRKTKQIKAN